MSKQLHRRIKRLHKRMQLQSLQIDFIIVKNIQEFEILEEKEGHQLVVLKLYGE